MTFDYEPEEADDSDPTGVSSAEHDRIMDRLMQEFGADNINVEKKETE